jgi:Secretion system C-terminal sorting domain
MKQFVTQVVLFCFLTIYSVFAQDYQRKVVEVPKADSGAIKIDGIMDEAVWQNAAHADLITSTGYEIFDYPYSRDGLSEPEFDELYGRMLWSKDTLYVFIHIDEFVNDSTDLFWIPTQGGHWGGDQLFVSLSNRLGVDMEKQYDGNVYAAPNGPYHFLIMGDSVTLNANDTTRYIPMKYRGCPDDSQKVFRASDISRYAVHIDTTTGLWDVEMAIYNPNVNANAKIGFNIGGSTSSRTAYAQTGDSYGYYTWQPNIPNDPFADPFGNGDPGFYNLANSDYWALLKFKPGTDDIIRKEVNVPMVDSGAIKIDGIMDEAAWQNAAHADLITNTGYEIFDYPYSRDGLSEPEFDGLYSRMLWSKDTLYVFVHIDEFVNDSTDLFWIPTQNGHWGGDQLFVSLSNRLGVDMEKQYDGNVYAAPNGPYHFLIMGDSVTLNANDTTRNIPEEYQGCPGVTQKVFRASSISRYAVHIDTTTGLWDVEMAIYNPNITMQASIGFNIGGSTSSRTAYTQTGDSYGYYTWQPNIPNDPFADPFGNGDPGFYNLANSDYWALLNFGTMVTGIKDGNGLSSAPTNFKLMQNYPNPFNPTTTIRFDVAKSSKITLKIYNVVGQVVATLINGKQYSAGAYSVNWNASNLASGVYFYRLETDNVQLIKKMVLLK